MKKTCLVLMVFGLCFSGKSLRADTTLLYENFDELIPQVGVSAVGEFQTINGTNVDIVGNSNGNLFGNLCVAPESGNCIDLDGSAGNPQGQLQSVNEFAAGTYNLSFDLNGSERGNATSTTVTFGNFDEVFNLLSTNGVEVEATVTLSSPSYLLFASNTPGNAGALLDNVDVYPSPEPSSWILLGAGLLALMGLAGRKFGGVAAS